MIIEGIFNACHNAPLFFSSSETSAVESKFIDCYENENYNLQIPYCRTDKDDV